MKILQVELGDRSYPILIGSGLLDDSQLIARYVTSEQVLLVSNEVVAPLYLQAVLDALADRQLTELILPDGESEKTLDRFATVMDALVEAGFNRDCCVVALGGGVVGDLAGFAAACYQRGVDLVQIPTTLLAQVDSSVGGKTAVNHAMGKNLIGAFYQPRAVIADTATLATLPDRELAAGIAEVIKYGAIMDEPFFAWLEQAMDSLLARDGPALGQAVERSCLCKARIVAADEREQGRRALLNFGHTFGHAIENLVGYGTLLHGEAVAIGMNLAASTSVRLGLISGEDADRIRGLLLRAGLPVTPPALDVQALLDVMAMDKKVVAGKLRLVLLEAVGQARMVDDVPGDLLRDVIGDSV